MKPEIRFKDFSKDWRSVPLEICLEICTELNAKNTFDVNDVLSVSDEVGVINQIKHLGRSYAGKSVSRYKVLRKGQIVYTKSPLRDKPFGIIKVNNGNVGIVSVLYAVYKTKDGIYPDFIQFYFSPSFRINEYFRPLVNKGAKNTMNISDEIALTGNVIIPSRMEEQEQISSYFDLFDTLIQTIIKKIASLKQIKAASLQSMFPQEGETIPRIRFKGFEGEWSPHPLKEFARKMIEKNTVRLYNETFTNSAEFGVISQRDFFDHDISNDDNISGYYVIHSDDFVYNPRISVTAPVGPINRNLLNRVGVMSPLYFIFRVEGVDKDYLGYFFKTTLWHKYMLIHGNAGARFDRLSIADDKFLDMPIILPKDISEQQKIADYFKTLDRQITLQTCRLEKLKQIKAACLDKMFV
ncbi:restriction endonuclease subunit S [Bacteroides congonensis]|jgi:type I restriction enzyme S subunit